MRAVVMRNGELAVDELPTPEPEPGEALVKTLSCGICGSDLHVLKHGEQFVETSRRSGGVFDMDLGRDIVMGHEFCAEVVDYGADTQRTLATGARVCAMPVLLRPGGIRTVGYSNDSPGGYGEYMILTEALLLPVPNGLSAEHAALTEPMAVGVHAVEKARLEPSDVALVVGCGPVGLAVIAALKTREVRPIIAADYSPLRRDLALTMGADIVVDPAHGSPYASWREAATIDDPAHKPPPWITGPLLRPAVIFECVGVPGVIDQIMEQAPKDARIIVVGVCMQADRFQPAYGINKELNLQFVLGYSAEEFAQTLGNIAAGVTDAAPLITAKVGVSGVAQAFEDLGSPDEHAKILVEPWRE
ncbi:MAG: zinc-binding dehydrogenase [Gammaproteobacteria bacterium]|nr:zinc-binding dehydrogenase [Gammaproteobacteria bacterium]HJP35710.1 zinc-binding dehydrogenase [Gammaproteobacteria bacterium]